MKGVLATRMSKFGEVGSQRFQKTKKKAQPEIMKWRIIAAS